MRSHKIIFGFKRKMMTKSKSAFTLVEVLISVLLLGIIFTYLYSTINSVKQQNNHYLEKTKTLKKEKQLFTLFSLDFAQALGSISISQTLKYDIVNFKTKNSLYEIIEPHVTYFVSKKENTLIRIESIGDLNFDNKDQIVKTFMYGDILEHNCTSFKALYENGFINLMMRSQNLKPMVLKIPTVG